MWPSKIDSNWSKHCCCFWFDKKNDRRIASRTIAESLNIPKTVVLRILKEELGKRKLCARFVPHSLIPEEREDRVTSCQDTIAMADADKNFLTIITEDETWCFVYNPRNKRTEFSVGWWNIPSAEEIEIPKARHQDHVDNFFRLSSRIVQRIRTTRKNSEYTIL